MHCMSVYHQVVHTVQESLVLFLCYIWWMESWLGKTQNLSINLARRLPLGGKSKKLGVILIWVSYDGIFKILYLTWFILLMFLVLDWKQCHWRVIRSSYRKLAWVRFEPTIIETIYIETIYILPQQNFD